MADVHSALGEATSWLRSQPGVERAALSVHMARRPGSDDSGEGFEIAWYVEVAHETGFAMDYVLELVRRDTWVIETAVRGNADEDEDRVLEFPDRPAVTDEELLIELAGAARMLAAARERALAAFVASLPVTGGRPG
ncbi:hypothetical protein [Actinoplanes sp. RD1]|uniref:hypothetical protein n=1 Tax=Actinoplanes sp. RD1 TaxID=3064538 RepID=UPI0027407D0C|nr:hypothetical protein [Actinoplanes sp. RD1]